jgi:hypothetical protein
MTGHATESVAQRLIRMLYRILTFHIAVAILTVVISGCGRNSPTTVSGSVTLDGRPLVIQSGMRGTVVFQPAEDGPVLNGIIDPDGGYALAAGSNVLVSPGMYTVAVSAVKITPPTDGNPEPSSERITPEKFASAAKSGLRVEVAPGRNDIDLRLMSESVHEDAADKAP